MPAMWLCLLGNIPLLITNASTAQGLIAQVECGETEIQDNYTCKIGWVNLDSGECKHEMPAYEGMDDIGPFEEDAKLGTRDSMQQSQCYQHHLILDV